MSRRLDSWKEIAEYLSRDVRTVIRWEQERGLPVHRVEEGSRQGVFAFTNEIDAWLRGPESKEPGPEHAAGGRSERPEEVRRVPGGRYVAPLLIAGLLVAVYFVARFFIASRGAADIPLRVYPSMLAVNSPAGEISYERREIQLPADEQIYFVQAADLNRDEAPDVVFASFSSGTVQAFLGKGDGTFGEHRSYGGCPGASQFVVGDFGNDGISDIAVTCYESNSVLLLRGNGDGTFVRENTLATPGGPRGLGMADFDGDGWRDLVVAATTHRPGLLMLWNQRGSFTVSRVLDADDIVAPQVEDLDGDGREDIAARVRLHRRVVLHQLRNTGRRHFDASTISDPGEDIPGHLGWAIGVGDFNRDGHVDRMEFSYGGTASLWQGSATGKFREAKSFSIPRGIARSVVHDLNDDGFLDVIFSSTQRGSISFLWGKADGTFAEPIEVQMGRYAVGLWVGDLNRDQLPDVALVLGQDDKIVVLLRRAPVKSDSTQ